MLLPPALLPPQDGLLSEDTAPATEHRLAEDATAVAHRVTEAPVAHRPAEDAAADAHGTTDVLAVVNTMMMHSEAMTPANAHRPAEDAIVQAHRDAEAPVAANATAHRNAEAPVAANATGDAVVPVRAKALDMLTDFVDMQEERAQRKRASNKEGSEQQPKAKAAKKEADAKSAGKQLKEATEAAPKTKAKAASKTSAKACTAPPAQRKTKHNKPAVSHEASRCQFLARSGASGRGSSQAFKYDPNDPAAKAKAEKDAKSWVAQFQS